jgi:hypothetical protein
VCTAYTCIQTAAAVQCGEIKAEQQYTSLLIIHYMSSDSGAQDAIHIASSARIMALWSAAVTATATAIATADTAVYYI